MGYYSNSDSDNDNDYETFYDGKPLKVMRKEFPHTDLLDMFYRINVRRPDSWYKSYRVRDFIHDLYAKGIQTENCLRIYLMSKGEDHNLNLAEEIICDIKRHLYIKMD